MKNRYIGRTFIMPGQITRKKSIEQKLNPIEIEFKNAKLARHRSQMRSLRTRRRPREQTCSSPSQGRKASRSDDTESDTDGKT